MTHTYPLDPGFRMDLQLFAEDGTDAEPEQQQAEPQEQPEPQERPAKTFTQADVDRLVAQRLARAQRDAEAKIKAARQEGFSEAEKLAKMTEQQRVEHEREQAERAAQEREQDLTRREAEIVRRELRATAVETLREKHLSVKLADALDYSSAEACQKSIELLEGVWRESIQEGVDQRLAASRGGAQLKRAPDSEAALLTQVRSAMGLKDDRKS